MNNYVVFLSGGETMCGTMVDDEFQRRHSHFISGDKRRQTFSGTDGEFAVEMGEVIAVGGNRTAQRHTIGF